LSAVLGRAAAPLIVGAIAGPLLGNAIVAARHIFVYRLPAEAGPWAIAALAGIIALAATAAAFTPARRALSVSTSEALRAD
jgi:ABC-type antimicrobial peptide transport system permease subunit